MIKAIETQYKGFRFRSRLEAKWAIFFDSLGIEWEYEPEGCDLGEEGWYLPDFRLTRTNTYIEIKPRTVLRDSTSFYLAGKIRKYDQDWRIELVHETTFLENIDEYKASQDRRHWMVGGNRFVGPYGLDTVNAGHGVGEGHITEGVYYEMEHGEEIEIRSGISELDRRIVFDTCKKQIASCDVVFAWIDSADCHGTIAEIGFAYAIGKRIWLGFSPDVSFDDFWFIRQMSEKSCVSQNAESALARFDRQMEPHEKKCAALSKQLGSNGTVILIEGEPGNDSHQASLFSDGQMMASGTRINFYDTPKHGPFIRLLLPGYEFTSFIERLNKAITAARSARFEHGERPK